MIEIRPEEPGDITAIRIVNRRAFGQDLEGHIVDALRANSAAVLSLVAIRDGRVVGHIMYSPLIVGDVVGAALGPMAVLPEDQRQGIGSKLVEAGNDQLARDGCLCIAVVGPTGDLVYFEKDDYCAYASVNIAQHKARAAARFRRPTLVFERLLAKGGFFAYLPTLGDDFIASRGGNPLMADGKVIGAIGASGGTGSQDDVVSQAGVAALK